ncbi:hypothetical protein OG948_54355 (plasmid) [Embleya sp. NBC_00888]|uniref:hypothetical protein n=1 Tax=Embleya sp. NBC_00888 TaxID=2975960 RepID=UPI002F90B910|nr:hypothetical protein OG948_54355 [Embleya sp. NBC_00888]
MAGELGSVGGVPVGGAPVGGGGLGRGVAGAMAARWLARVLVGGLDGIAVTANVVALACSVTAPDAGRGR